MKHRQRDLGDARYLWMLVIGAAIFGASLMWWQWLPEHAKTTPRSEQRGSALSKPATVAGATPAAPASAGVAAGASTSQLSSAATQGAPTMRGPGATLTFDPDNAPLVPQGVSAEQYVDSYYEALRGGSWATAFRLLPRTDPGETLADFRNRSAEYALKSFSVLGLAPGVEDGILVVHITPAGDTWNVTWRFEKTKRGRVVRDLIYARPGGAGCH